MWRVSDTCQISKGTRVRKNQQGYVTVCVRTRYLFAWRMNGLRTWTRLTRFSNKSLQPTAPQGRRRACRVVCGIARSRRSYLSLLSLLSSSSSFFFLLLFFRFSSFSFSSSSSSSFASSSSFCLDFLWVTAPRSVCGWSAALPCASALPAPASRQPQRQPDSRGWPSVCCPRWCAPSRSLLC